MQVLVPDTDDDAEYGGTGHVYKPCYLDATRQVIVERPVLQIPSCTPEIINRVYESADIKTMTEDRIKNAKSDAGNINIENGFELYEKCVLGKLSDRYINVRESESQLRRLQFWMRMKYKRQKKEITIAIKKIKIMKLI